MGLRTPILALALAACGGAQPEPSARVADVRPVTLASEEPRPIAAASPLPEPEPVPALVPDPTPAPAVAAPDPLAPAVRPDLANGYVVTGSTRHRLLLFTFDDGPHPVRTRALLRELAHAEVRAVFFVVARRLAQERGFYSENAAVLREIAAAGHVIASHTRDHLILTQLDEAEAAEQILGAEQLIEQALGARPWLFRPPGGMHSEVTDRLLAERGYTLVLWNMGTSDYVVHTPEQVVQNFRDRLAARAGRGVPGGVIVLHDTHRWTVDAFPRLVRYVDRRNCELLARGEELYDIVDDPGIFVVPRATGASPSDPAPMIELAPEVLEARQARARERAIPRCRRMRIPITRPR